MKKFFLLIISSILIVLDQITKYFALTNLKNQAPIVLIENVLEFNYTENRGAAFGILQNKLLVFILITIFALGYLLYLLYKLNTNHPYYKITGLCFSLIIAGAIGNFIDRLARCYVVDFIYFKLIDFPVFNLADSYITVSVVILLIIFFLSTKHKKEDIFL